MWMTREIGLLGVPTSMGAFAPGQEKAPQALRQAGIVERLTSAGLDVVDHGDSPVQRWRPDAENRFAQNLPAVVEVALDTAGRVRRAIAAGQTLLVVGGDCTVELGTISGSRSADERIGLVYFDAHPDLNTPSSVPDGALDWMGMAHALGLTGTESTLSDIGPCSPLLAPEDVLFFAYDPSEMTEWEHEVFARRGLQGVPLDEVASDPEGAAEAALVSFGPRFDRLLVHLDVDVMDFADAPLSELTKRNKGLSFDQTARALRALLGDDRFQSLTVTEINPDHGDTEGNGMQELVEALVEAIAGSSAHPTRTRSRKGNAP